MRRQVFLQLSYICILRVISLFVYDKDSNSKDVALKVINVKI